MKNGFSLIVLIALVFSNCRTQPKKAASNNDEVKPCPEVFGMMRDLMVLDTNFAATYQYNGMEYTHSGSSNQSVYKDSLLQIFDLKYPNLGWVSMNFDNKLIVLESHDGWSKKKVYDYGACIAKEITVVGAEEQQIVHFDFNEGGKCFEIVNMYGIKTITDFVPIRHCGYPRDSILNPNQNYPELLPVRKTVYKKVRGTNRDTSFVTKIPIENYLIRKH